VVVIPDSDPGRSDGIGTFYDTIKTYNEDQLKGYVMKTTFFYNIRYCKGSKKYR
jgi:hypothetical protein